MAEYILDVRINQKASGMEMEKSPFAAGRVLEATRPGVSVIPDANLYQPPFAEKGFAVLVREGHEMEIQEPPYPPWMIFLVREGHEDNEE